VLGVEQVDTHGYAAGFELERVLAGSLAPGERLRIAWEELARQRPPRFAQGDRALVALETLPTASLWRTRFPKGDAMVVAERGQAFLISPDPETLRLLGEHLALAPEQRSGNAAVPSLVAMVAGAEPGLAGAALARLGGIPDVDSLLGSRGVEKLAQVIGDPERPAALRRRVIDLAGSRRLSALRPAVAAQAQRGAPNEAAAWMALARIDGGLSSKQVTTLLARGEAGLRAVGIANARGTEREAEVARLLGADPAPEVRLAALEAWILWKGAAGLDAAQAALFDPDRAVRGHAARAIGALGPDAVPHLERLVMRRDAEQAVAPIAALSFAGPKGIAVLKKLEASHPDPQVRKLIRIALGEKFDTH
jgi:hypothetical protein